MIKVEYISLCPSMPHEDHHHPSHHRMLANKLVDVRLSALSDVVPPGCIIRPDRYDRVLNDFKTGRRMTMLRNGCAADARRCRRMLQALSCWSMPQNRYTSVINAITLYQGSLVGILSLYVLSEPHQVI